VIAPDYRVLITSLIDHDVEFVVVGGIALVLHGSARVTRDLDICYSRERRNLKAIAAALAGLRPTLRGATADLPFTLDWQTLESGLNFTLTTSAGDIDLLGELVGIGSYQIAARLSEQMQIYDKSVPVLSLAGLETTKRAAGRLRDLADLAEIQEIRRQRRA
jgi:hypothetical protein